MTGAVDWTVPDLPLSWSVTLLNDAAKTPFQWVCRAARGEDPETLALEDYRLSLEAYGLAPDPGARILEKRVHRNVEGQAWIALHGRPGELRGGDEDPASVLRQTSGALRAAVMAEAAAALLPEAGAIVADVLWGFDGDRQRLTITSSLLWVETGNRPRLTIPIAMPSTLRRRINAISLGVHRRSGGGRRRMTVLEIPASASARAALRSRLARDAEANAIRADGANPVPR